VVEAGAEDAISVGDEQIEATAGHPFWVVERAGHSSVAYEAASWAATTVPLWFAGEESLTTRSSATEFAGPVLTTTPKGQWIATADSTSDGTGRWVAAADLAVGDELLLLDGDTATIWDIDTRHENTTVYNFHVERTHSYAVSSAGVLVHNGSSIDGPSGVQDVPGRPFRGKTAAEDAYKHLEEHHGIDPHTASNRLHKIKEQGGLGAADDVVIGRTGDVYDARTGEHIGSLTDSTLGPSARGC
jgi:hypothetical protein